MKLPSEMIYWERVRFTILFLITLLSLLGFIHITETRAHPDGIKPYWFPSTFIYGFIGGCSQTVEENRSPITREFWPEEVRTVCSCVMDAIRHSMTFEEAQDDSKKPKMQVIVDGTFPVCVEQSRLNKNDNN